MPHPFSTPHIIMVQNHNYSQWDAIGVRQQGTCSLIGPCLCDTLPLSAGDIFAPLARGVKTLYLMTVTQNIVIISTSESI